MAINVPKDLLFSFRMFVRPQTLAIEFQLCVHFQVISACGRTTQWQFVLEMMFQRMPRAKAYWGI